MVFALSFRPKQVAGQVFLCGPRNDLFLITEFSSHQC